MYGDFSRLVFVPERYTAVLSQQGRVQLDSDANELTSILLNHIRTLTVDLFGPFGTGYPGTGFSVRAVPGRPGELQIKPGHYYVHGLRCTLDNLDPGAPGGAMSWNQVADGPHGVASLPDPPYVIEVVAWEESISAVQEPSLLEPALGPNPPDTTVRLRVRFRLAVSSVRPDGHTELTGTESADQLRELYFLANTADSHRPTLRARVRHPEPDPEAPQLAVAAGYSRAENQLYRIEVHSGGSAGTATFKWSRNNGSDEYSVDRLDPGIDEQTIARLSARARDAREDLAVNDWVQVCDASWLPDDAPTPLQQITGYDRELGLVTMVGPSTFDPHRLSDVSGSYLRRWDQDDEVDSADNAVRIPADPDAWYDLEDGVQVQFSRGKAHYHSGDYWLVPARTATGGVLWPDDPREGGPLAVPASRPPRYRAPLALVTEDGSILDLRVQLAPGAAATTLSDAAPNDAGQDSQPTGDGDGDGDGDAGEPPPEMTQLHAVVAVPVSAPTPQAAPILVHLKVLPYEGGRPAKSTVEEGRLFPRPAGQASIGRTPPNDILLDDSSVSRSHAAISVEPGRVMLWETGTRHADGSSTGPTNGTFVNEAKITGSTRLNDNDIVRVGAVRLGVEFVDPDMDRADPT